MLSTFLATFSSESLLGDPFPLFEPGFPTWENHEPVFPFHLPPPQEDDPVVFTPQSSHEPVSSGSDTSNPAPSPGSGEPIRDYTKNLSSGSDELDRMKSNSKGSGCGGTSLLGTTIDERKRRRMISNRESARRSRMRKQKHVDNLRNQVNRLKVENRELMNRLRWVVHHTRLFWTENEYLRSESVVLRQRLWDIRQVLLARQLLNPTCINNQGLLSPHALIT
ncbi:basic leucine zipper 43 [Phtheirospermum japonicum]|uniref:Basic leucine zipper 43 n=1 Tax=Phtheirospermum japonicum TaxID=374723 RepID=A0A830CKU7_9LAMI|nr:basic leucine zipper 43 [Phtheirospermum japonicum]